MSGKRKEVPVEKKLELVRRYKQGESLNSLERETGFQRKRNWMALQWTTGKNSSSISDAMAVTVLQDLKRRRFRASVWPKPHRRSWRSFRSATQRLKGRNASGKRMKLRSNMVTRKGVEPMTGATKARAWSRSTPFFLSTDGWMTCSQNIRTSGR